MTAGKQEPDGSAEADHQHLEARAELRRSRAADMAEWDRQFVMLKHPGLTHAQAVEAERAEAEAALEASMSWEELMRHRYLQPPSVMQAKVAAQFAELRQAEEARAAEERAAAVMMRAERNRGAFPSWRTIVFCMILLIILVAPYWGR